MKIQNLKNLEKYCNTSLRKAFTLVELIIVITILSILSTIGLMSFQGYMGDARDASRTSSLDEIRKGLEIYEIKNSNLPLPTNYITITASGTPIGYQGIFGKTEADLIKMTSLPIDPLDNTGYVYSINSLKNKFQLLTFLENQTAYNKPINDVYAIDYSNRKIKTIGDRLGILLDISNNPITSNVETQTGNINYNIVFTDNNSYTLSGNIFSIIYNFIEDKNKAFLDKSLLRNYDMETITSDGKIKDLTLNQKDLIPFGNPIIGSNIGVKGKSTNFNGNGQFFSTASGSLILSGATTNIFTYSVLLKLNSFGSGSIIGEYNNNSGNGVYAHKIQLLPLDMVYDNYQPSGGGFRISNQMNLDNYYNITFVRNGTNGYFYLNGNLISSTGSTSAIETPTSIVNTFTVGAYLAPNETYGTRDYIMDKAIRYFNGDIDDIKIYNRALSDSEIKALYDSTK